VGACCGGVDVDCYRELLEALKLEGLDSRKPSQLSGGQAQRVGIARALIRRAPVVLFDEPLASVDEEMSANRKTIGGERRGGTEGGVGQREFDETTFVRVGSDESAFGIPLSGGNVGGIAHHGEMGTGLALVGEVEATAIVVEKGETEQEGGEGDADGGENGRRGAAEKE